MTTILFMILVRIIVPVGLILSIGEMVKRHYQLRQESR